MLNYGSTSLCFTSIWRDCVGWLVGTWKGDCLSNSSHLRNLMVHCLFVRSQTNSYQVLEILREDWATKRFPLAYPIHVRMSHGQGEVWPLHC
jgi:hypothetical protein